MKTELVLRVAWKGYDVDNELSDYASLNATVPVIVTVQNGDHIIELDRERYQLVEDQVRPVVEDMVYLFESTPLNTVGHNTFTTENFIFLSDECGVVYSVLSVPADWFAVLLSGVVKALRGTSCGKIMETQIE